MRGYIIKFFRIAKYVQAILISILLVLTLSNCGNNLSNTNSSNKNSSWQNSSYNNLNSNNYSQNSSSDNSSSDSSMVILATVLNNSNGKLLLETDPEVLHDNRLVISKRITEEIVDCQNNPIDFDNIPVGAKIEAIIDGRLQLIFPPALDGRCIKITVLES